MLHPHLSFDESEHAGESDAIQETSSDIAQGIAPSRAVKAATGRQICTVNMRIYRVTQKLSYLPSRQSCNRETNLRFQQASLSIHTQKLLDIIFPTEHS